MKPSTAFLLVIFTSTSIAACSKDDNNAEQAEAQSPAPAASPGPQSASSQEMDDKIAHGEKTHNVHCYKCHTDEVYTRENRFVKSIDALSKQVVRCKDGNNIAWFDEDTDAVVQFLNNKYYRF